MKCPLCQVEMRISRSKHVLENDDTPDVQTRLFVEQTLTCLNKQCTNFETEVDKVRNEIPLG